MVAVLIKSNNEIEYVDDLSTENLQKIIGGYIEIILLKIPMELKNDKYYIMVVNEEARLIELPHNEIASEVYNRNYGYISIKGNVLFVDSEDFI